MSKPKVYTKPILLPFNADGSIYVLQDETGEAIGTGTREVCEVLLRIVNSQQEYTRGLRVDVGANAADHPDRFESALAE